MDRETRDRLRAEAERRKRESGEIPPREDAPLENTLQPPGDDADIEPRPSSSDARAACPHCLEPIKAGARVCKHCGRDVKAKRRAPRPRGGMPSWAIAAGVVLLVAGLALFSRGGIGALAGGRGIEGGYLLGIGSARVVITSSTIVWPGNAVDRYERLPGGRLKVTSPGGEVSEIGWRWRGDILVLTASNGLPLVELIPE